MGAFSLIVVINLVNRLAMPLKARNAKGRPVARKPNSKDNDDKMSKQEKAVAKYLYNNVENKKATMYGNKKLYFSGANAVQCLMDSKFAQGSASERLFNNRKMAVDFCQTLIMKNAFHHVLKVVKKQKPRTKESGKEDSSKQSKSKEKTEPSSEKTKSSKKSANKDSKDVSPGAAGDQEEGATGLRKRAPKKESTEKSETSKEKKDSPFKSKSEGDDSKASSSKSSKSNPTKGAKDSVEGTGDGQTKKKVKGKVLLDLKPNQTFYDDAKCYYVWVYEAQSLWKNLVGGGLIIGSILICLFPLWPEWVQLV